ncbi:glycosyltransferase family 61 protein [Ensifer sp. Root127]|uniref:glycosyltransferase family 61 protein n=1 Tax=Ensifer sp. Root127 TaxID=1736440 RepID=UPI00070B0497|nr:glycosyltransferase family 61 protein [Ensifer sp. Root127]KQW61017.1 hypothetical protein ASD03_36750 [Ensifer sp. Root127]
MVELVSIRDIHHVAVATEESPPFFASPPKVTHLDFIPLKCHSAMAPAWYTRNFPASNITIDKVFDVFVTSEGLALTRDGRIIAETVTQHSLPEQEQAVEHVAKGGSPTVIDTSCLLMRKRGDSNYGHWLIEILPKLGIARSHCHVSGLAIPLLEGAMRLTVHGSLKIADSLVTTPRYELAKESLYFFRELIVVSGATNHGVFMSPLVVGEIKRLTEGMRGERAGKIFVSRRGANRTLANEDVIERELAVRGFEIVHPGSMTFEEQIRAFLNANIVVGVMGAGLTNMVFAQTGAKIVNLAPAAMPDTFFYFLSVHREQRYHEIRGKNVSGSDSWEERFDVSLDDILEAVA